jgi:tRNA U34 5-carboxymethylaminomethyl modifying GTPase MnmE/TrmE
MAQTDRRVDIANVRATLTEMYNVLKSVITEIVEDHKKISVCSQYSSFAKELPTAWLERAGERLRKKEYKIAFVGPFKAGKSTFLSALLKQPGMLPAEDAECTFSVGVVAAPPPGEQEHVKATYYTAEEALRNILTHSRYYKLFEWDQKTREDLLKNFAADRAIEFIRDSAEKGASGDRKEEAEELSDPKKGFIAAYKQYRDRMGKTHVDAIDNLKIYVRKEEGIGHLLLIKIVEIFRNNPVLAKQGFQIADTPGTDSMNEAARVITLTYLKEADAVIYLAEARGLSTNFNVIREELTKFHNDIREKMFIVANKADWYEIKSMRKEGASKAPIEVVFENIVNPLRALGLNESKLFFTAGRMSELSQKKEMGQLSADESQQFNIMRKALDEKIEALSENLNPTLHKLLTTCFRDGGVDSFRKVVIDYLEYDIQVERLKEVFMDLNKAHQSLDRLLGTEQSRIKDALANAMTVREQIVSFFEKARDTFLDKVAVINSAAPKAVPMLVDQAKQKVVKNIEDAVDRINIERIKLKLKVPTPLNIKMEVINYFKADFSNKYPDQVRETVSPAIGAKMNELVQESRVGGVISHLAKELGTDHDRTFDRVIDRFTNGVDRFTEMRAREETWELMDTELKPQGFEIEWSEQVEKDFRADCKEIFVQKFVDYCGKLNQTLARHYQALIKDLIRDFDRLIENIQEAIKKDPDRVTLPVKLLTGTEEESEDEKKKRCLLNYFRAFETAKKMHAELAPNFPSVK